jgi:hypothetical protein
LILENLQGNRKAENSIGKFRGASEASGMKRGYSPKIHLVKAHLSSSRRPADQRTRSFLHEGAVCRNDAHRFPSIGDYRIGKSCVETSTVRFMLGRPVANATPLTPDTAGSRKHHRQLRPSEGFYGFRAGIPG